MFRSLLFAIGIFLLIFGAQTLFVDKWIMSYELPTNQTAVANNGYYNNRAYRNSPYRTAGYNRGRTNQVAYSNSSTAGQVSGTIKPVYQTRDWMPWSLLAGGTLLVLYTYSIGQRSVE
jgi:hypothetical protein